MTAPYEKYKKQLAALTDDEVKDVLKWAEWDLDEWADELIDGIVHGDYDDRLSDIANAVMARRIGLGISPDKATVDPQKQATPSNMFFKPRYGQIVKVNDPTLGYRNRFTGAVVEVASTTNTFAIGLCIDGNRYPSRGRSIVGQTVKLRLTAITLVAENRAEYEASKLEADENARRRAEEEASKDESIDWSKYTGIECEQCDDPVYEKGSNLCTSCLIAKLEDERLAQEAAEAEVYSDVSKARRIAPQKKAPPKKAAAKSTPKPIRPNVRTGVGRNRG